MKKWLLIYTLMMIPLIMVAASYAENKNEAIYENFKIVGTDNVTVNSQAYAGQATIYQLNGETWKEIQTIQPSDPAYYKRFGVAVAIYGDYALIGAFGGDGNNTSYYNYYGAAYIFKRSNNTWKQTQKIELETKVKSDYFGYSVALYKDYALISAYYDDDNYTNSGSVYIYKRDQENWVLCSKIIGNKANDNFGYTLSISDCIIKVSGIDTPFTYIPLFLTISGFIYDVQGNPISGVDLQLTNNGGTTSTNSSGYYSHEVIAGWSGVVIPERSGFKFTPLSLPLINIIENKSNQNFSGQRYTISGYIKDDSGRGIPGVRLIFSNGAGEIISHDNGLFSHDINYHWQGTVTPQKNGFEFNPASYSFDDITSNHFNTDFLGHEKRYTISGVIKDHTHQGVDGVSVCFGESTNCIQTNTNGFYQHDVEFQWSDSVFPHKEGYSFLPESTHYTMVSCDMPSHDYTAIIHTFMISGRVYDKNQTPIPGVTLTMSNSDETIETDQSGYYQFEKHFGWQSILTPEKEGYGFDPPSWTIPAIQKDLPNSDFIANKQMITISGIISDQNNNPVSGVYIKFSNSGMTTTNSAGVYSFPVEYGWSGKAYVFKMNHAFVPTSNSYNFVKEPIIDQKYSAFPGNHPGLFVTPDVKTVTSNSGTISFSVYTTPSTLDWQFKKSNSWINVQKNGASMIVTFQDNPEHAQRTAVITLTATDAANSPQDIVLIQDGKPQPEPGPGWEKALNASLYQYCQNITATITNEKGDTLHEDNDMLAAFMGDELRGVARPMTTSCGKRYFLQVWSNQPSGEDITFMHYSGATDRMNVNIKYPVSFNSQESLGSILAPHHFIVSDYYIYTPLNKYWNWITINVMSESMSVNDVLASIKDKGIIIIGQDGYAEYMPDYKTWQGSLNTIKPTAMYMLKTNDTVYLEFAGNAIDHANYPIELHPNWNWIGYLPSSPMGMNHALASIKDNAVQICGQEGFAGYVKQEGWFGSIDTLLPNRGYKINMQVEDTLYYPAMPNENRKTRSMQKSHVKSSINGWSFDPSMYQYQITVTSEVMIDQQVQGNEGDALVAFVDGICRGIAKPVNTPYGTRFFLQIWGNQGETVTTQFYRASDQTIHSMMFSLVFEPDTSIGTIASPQTIQDNIPQGPGWEVHSSQFREQATLTAIILDNAQEIGQYGDLLGAFSENNECRGIAKPVETPYGIRFFLQMWSNEACLLTLKFYDASNNEIVDTVQSIQFKADQLMGAIEHPEAISLSRPNADYIELITQLESENAALTHLVNENNQTILNLNLTIETLNTEINNKDAQIIQLRSERGYTDQLTKGWHMKSGIYKEATPKTNPEGCISVMYGFTNGAYVITETFLPGQGYWVKIKDECETCEFIMNAD